MGAFPLMLLDGGMYVFYVTTTKERIQQARRDIMAEVDRLYSEPVTWRELEQARNELLGAYLTGEQAYDSLALNTGLFELYYGDYSLYLEYPDRIKQVDSKNLRELIKLIFRDNPRSVVILGTKEPNLTAGRAGQ